jgi:hypothetical protein
MTTTPIPQHSSASNEHYTPREIIEVCRATMGGIDLDPASCELANRENVRARKFYAKDDNGLSLPWKHGPFGETNGARVFCNPPGGKYKNGMLVLSGAAPISVEKGPGDSSAAIWFFRAVDEWTRGHADAVCFLGFTLELLRLTQRRQPSAARFPFCILRDRTDFLCERDGKLVTQGSPTHANVLILVTDSRKLALNFEIEAAQLGDVVVPAALPLRSARWT